MTLLAYVSETGDLRLLLHLPSFTGKLSWDITTTQVNSAFHPSRVAKSSTSLVEVKAVKSPLLGGR